MSLTFTGKKRIRKSFGRIPEVVRMPNLIEVQKSSYNQFLQKSIPHEDRGDDEGMNGVFIPFFLFEISLIGLFWNMSHLFLSRQNLTKKNVSNAI